MSFQEGTELPNGARPFEDFLAGYRSAGLKFPAQLDVLLGNHQIILPVFLKDNDLQNGLRVRCKTKQFSSCEELEKDVYYDVSEVVNAAIGHARINPKIPDMFRKYCVVQITVA